MDTRYKCFNNATFTGFFLRESLTRWRGNTTQTHDPKIKEGKQIWTTQHLARQSVSFNP
jgi:hypothetical protein